MSSYTWIGLLTNFGISTISSTVSQALPSRTTVVVTATLGLTGSTLGGLPGLALGVGLGIAISPIANGAVDVIATGAGQVALEVKSCCKSTAKWVKSTIYCILESLFGCLARWSETSSWVKSVYAKVNESYLNANTHLRSLFTPVAAGVAEQEYILNALITQAKEADQNITPEQIRSWVALGERLVQAFTTSRPYIKNNAMFITVESPTGKVEVESSLYTIRAITWYITAQALWHAAVKESDRTPSPKKMDDIADANKDATTFVVPDPCNKLFHFIQAAPSSYKDQANLLNETSDSKEQKSDLSEEDMKVCAINDVAKMLPQENQGLIINPLKAIGSGPKRLAIRLQKLPNLSLLEGGQRREGHESLTWRAIQRLTSGSSKLMNSIAEWNPDKKIEVQTSQQSRHREIHQTVIKALKVAGVKLKDHKKDLDKIPTIPLFSLLQLFKESSEYAKNHRDLYNLFNRMSNQDYNNIKNAIADVIELEARGDLEQVKVQEGDEVWVPTNLRTERQIRHYVAGTKNKLHAALTVYRQPKIGLIEGAHIQMQTAIGGMMTLGNKTVGNTKKIVADGATSLFRFFSSVADTAEEFSDAIHGDLEYEDEEPRIEEAELETDEEEFFDASNGEIETETDDEEFFDASDEEIESETDETKLSQTAQQRNRI